MTIGLASSNTAEGTVSPASLVFPNSNYYTPQTVTVTGVDDLVADENITFTVITAFAVSSDNAYNGLDPSDVTVMNMDNDRYIVSGTISGLTQTRLQIKLQESGVDKTTISPFANDTSFSFPTTSNIATGNIYNEIITAQPLFLTCSLTNASGTMGTVNITNVGISCLNEVASGPLAVSNLTINGIPGASQIIAGGTLITFNFAYSILPYPACPGCAAPVLVGIVRSPAPLPASMISCTDSSQGVTNSNYTTTTLVLPTSPGTYTINTWSSWDFCSNFTPIFTNQGSTIAIITVP